MDFEKRIQAFAELGRIFTDAGAGPGEKAVALKKLVREVHHRNGWFTEANVRFMLQSLGGMLAEDKLKEWAGRYRIPVEGNAKRVGVICAGNVPMVCFHDLLCVLMSGNVFIGKLSSADDQLLPEIVNILVSIEPGFARQAVFTEKLSGIDAVIATGSDNSSRYFEYYFSKYPHLFRKNRNSVAVLDGTETREELLKLGEDIFRYFGLGCRNVSKLFVPAAYDFKNFFEAIYPFSDVINHKKYGNNYEYYRAIFLLNKVPLLDNNFILLKEDRSLASPVGVLHYEHYENPDEVNRRLEQEKKKIQCIVAKGPSVRNAIPFGTTQHPDPWDYADSVDTMKFLLSIK